MPYALMDLPVRPRTAAGTTRKADAMKNDGEV